MAKVIVINGSPRADQCTATALDEMIKTFNEEGVETELIHVGNKSIRGCAACGYCSTHDGCVFKDIVNEVNAKLEMADGLVVGSPVYYSSPNGTLISFLDRLFYSAQYDMHMKVGAAVVSARRGGTTASFDVLNKYFSISGMPIATSTYWNQVHGFTADDVRKDKEGADNEKSRAQHGLHDQGHRRCEGKIRNACGGARQLHKLPGRQVKEETHMCLSTVYKNEIGDANMLAKNVADIKVDGGTIIFTDLMGIRYTFNGTLEKVDLMDNYVLVKDA